MKILQVHNYYQFSGGEDIVVSNEKKMLELNGNEVIFYKRVNNEISEYSFFNKVSLIWKTSWSDKTYNEISKIIGKTKPDICHVHNMFPLISPSIYYACNDNKVPVVQTIHNYRFFCTNGYFFRDNHICEECINSNAFRAVKYKCYRNSKVQTYSAAKMLESHKKKNTWREKINILICPSKFVKSKFIQGGFSENKLIVKPNFLPYDPEPSYNNNDYFLYAGRIDNLKGIKVLSSALLDRINTNVKIIGDGPEINKLKENKNLQILNKRSNNETINYIKNCISLIFPSICYETFGLSIIEAFACGKPVIASRLGAMEDLVEEGKSGLLFEPGNSDDLRNKIVWAIEHKAEMKEMGKNARKIFEDKYTAELNYKILLSIYNNIISNSKKD